MEQIETKQSKVIVEEVENGYIIEINGKKNIATSRQGVGTVIGKLFSDNLEMISENTSKVFFDINAGVLECKK